MYIILENEFLMSVYVARAVLDSQKSHVGVCHFSLGLYENSLSRADVSSLLRNLFHMFCSKQHFLPFRNELELSP